MTQEQFDKLMELVKEINDRQKGIVPYYPPMNVPVIPGPNWPQPWWPTYPIVTCLVSNGNTATTKN